MKKTGTPATSLDRYDWSKATRGRFAKRFPQWMAEELDRREREDAGTEEDGEQVMARLLAKHSRRG
jgi:hypothetical protein